MILATPQEPFKYPAPDGVRGIDADVVSHVMKALGIAFKIQLIRSDSRILENAKLGKADMLLLFSKKPEREVFLHFPERSYIDLSWHFFIRAEDEGKLNYQTFADLVDLNIGATRNLAYTPEFWDAGLSLQLVSNNDLQIKKLMAGRIDIVALNTINTLYEAQRHGYAEEISFLPKPLKKKPYYNVFPKASVHPDREKVLAAYDRIIGEMIADGKMTAIFRRYLGDSYPIGMN
ncbi:substrate-binding periplasmic protein [Aestuariispira insulae]|nr:transporter substrate-binding domain-containing protein [Aestuariispira insulae]